LEDRRDRLPRRRLLGGEGPALTKSEQRLDRKMRELAGLPPLEIRLPMML
jgi:hypothetical protein